MTTHLYPIIRRVLLAGAFAAAGAVPVAAQHPHGGHTAHDTTHAEHDTLAMHDHEGRDHGHGATTEHEATPASSALLPGVPMGRDASGTSWQPDTSPMYAIHIRAGDLGLMFHGAAFLRYTAQDVADSGTRGGSQLDAPNWFMAMGQYQLARGSQIGVRTMLSLDRLTEGGEGYPLLFQTGETFEGRPLIDRQHPHDLFSELAVTYGQRLSDRAGVFAYVGYPGEPALGPPAFMHRASAQHNPDSPLGHHWQDATHIVFGVATLGFRYGPVKVDGSIFTGREPDEERFGFDRPRFDSYSLRLTANPTDRLSLQVSRGFLKSPESVAPDEDEWRTTASALYSTPVGRAGNWASSLVWGLNDSAGEDEHGHQHGHGPLHAALVETDLDFGRQAVYGRAEWTQKTAESLGLCNCLVLADEPAVAFEPNEQFGIGALTLGAATDLVRFADLQLELGAQGTLYRVPEAIRPVYGEQPVSLQVYLRLSPTRMLHASASRHRPGGHGMPH